MKTALSKIEAVRAIRVYDSRANPTVEVEITLADGTTGRGIVPSGASTGKFEALELRDKKSAFDGKGVDEAIKNVNEILGPKIIGIDARDQKQVDTILIETDGTKNKERYGANAILGCSLAACHAAANFEKKPLYRYLGGALANVMPVPMVQIIGGGAHAANAIDIQDFLVIPLSAKSFEEGYAMVVETYIAAKKIFKASGRPLSIADEGGLWPTGFSSNEEGIQLLVRSIEEAGYIPGTDLGIALDVASSEFYDEENMEYVLALENRRLSSVEFVDMLCEWADKYPIVSIEDGTSETDWEGSRLLTEKLGNRIQLIGDDLFTTNIERIRNGIEKGCCNSVLIKMNQIGTITETMEAISYTQKHGYNPVISARSGESEDASIVHLAIASGAGQLKVGSVARSERTAKWNEAIRIEKILGGSAYYPSNKIFSKL